MNLEDEDFLFISIAQAANFFGIVPYLDFQNNILITKRQYKRQVIVLIFILLFLVSISIWEQLLEARFLGFILKALSVWTPIGLYLSQIVQIINSYRKRTVWQKLFYELSLVNKTLSTKKSNLERKMSKNTRGYLLLLNLMIFLILYFDYAVAAQKQETYMGTILYFSLFPLANFILFSFTFMERIVIIILLLTIKTRYQCVNKHLCGLKYKDVRIKNDLLRTLKKIELLVLYLHNIVNHFKMLFEISFFFMVANAFHISLVFSLLMARLGFLATILWLIYFLVSTVFYSILNILSLSPCEILKTKLRR